MTTDKQQSETILQGIAAAPGIVMGKAYVYTKHIPRIEERFIEAGEVEQEIARLKIAVERSERELQKILALAEQKIGEAKSKIFEAQIMILSDAVLLGAITKRIAQERRNAEYIVHAEITKYQQLMLSAQDEYMRERAHEVEDIKNRIIRNIQQEKLVSWFEEKTIVISHSLTPADTILFSRNEILGYATDVGGVTSHAALLARSLKIPAVVGLKNVTTQIQTGDFLILDGYAGTIIIRPTPESLQAGEVRRHKILKFEEKLLELRDLPAETLDGKHIELSSNIEFSEEVDYVRSQGSSGIGLYRAEGLLMGRDMFPTEEEQYQEYKKIAEHVFPHRAILRTFDIGGDKVDSESTDEDNPFLGWRGIRVLLDRPDLFAAQVRAILRASTKKNLWIMFPMIANLKEVRQAKEMVHQMKIALKTENISFDRKIKVGVMIEVPSAAVMAGDIAKEVDFLSIGTNDLIQYLMAVDRGNETVSHLYQEFNPAVLRTVRHIIKEAHVNKIPVGMCGEMAGDPLATLLLLGLGLDEFSVTPTVLPEIKKIIRSVTLKEAQKIAVKAMTMSTEDDVKQFLIAQLKHIAPDIPLQK